jgi:hypothetical protein
MGAEWIGGVFAFALWVLGFGIARRYTLPVLVFATVASLLVTPSQIDSSDRRIFPLEFFSHFPLWALVALIACIVYFRVRRARSQSPSPSERHVTCHRGRV